MFNLLMAPMANTLEICKIKERNLGVNSQLRHLNNLGFVESAKISVVSENGGNLIVRVKDCKIAIGKDIAKAIYVA